MVPYSISPEPSFQRVGSNSSDAVLLLLLPRVPAVYLSLSFVALSSLSPDAFVTVCRLSFLSLVCFCLNSIGFVYPII